MTSITKREFLHDSYHRFTTNENTWFDKVISGVLRFSVSIIEEMQISREIYQFNKILYNNYTATRTCTSDTYRKRSGLHQQNVTA